MAFGIDRHVDPAGTDVDARRIVGELKLARPNSIGCAQQHLLLTSGRTPPGAWLSLSTVSSVTYRSHLVQHFLMTSRKLHSSGALEPISVAVTDIDFTFSACGLDYT